MRAISVGSRARRYKLNWLSKIILSHYNHFLGLTWKLWLRLIASLFSNAHQHCKLLLKVHVFVEQLLVVRTYLFDCFLLPSAHLLIC